MVFLCHGGWHDEFRKRSERKLMTDFRKRSVRKETMEFSFFLYFYFLFSSFYWFHSICICIANFFSFHNMAFNSLLIIHNCKKKKKKKGRLESIIFSSSNLSIYHVWFYSDKVLQMPFRFYVSNYVFWLMKSYFDLKRS